MCVRLHACVCICMLCVWFMCVWCVCVSLRVCVRVCVCARVWVCCVVCVVCVYVYVRVCMCVACVRGIVYVYRGCVGGHSRAADVRSQHLFVAVLEY